MNELALFAGVGGGILGGKLLGWTTVCAVEVEPYCRAVLCQRQNERVLQPFPIWDDIHTFSGKMWRGGIDVITGGFPCQAYSTAARGHNTAKCLWPEMLRVIGEVCPRYVFAENTSQDAIIQAQADLTNAGYKTIRVAIGASDLGGDHIRKRWWLLADADNEGKLGCTVNAEMAVLENRSQALWGTNPGTTRMDGGLAHRVDRFKAIGNGQLPLVAATAWSVLTDAMNET